MADDDRFDSEFSYTGASAGKETPGDDEHGGPGEDPMFRQDPDLGIGTAADWAADDDDQPASAQAPVASLDKPPVYKSVRLWAAVLIVAAVTFGGVKSYLKAKRPASLPVVQIENTSTTGIVPAASVVTADGAMGAQVAAAPLQSPGVDPAVPVVAAPSPAVISVPEAAAQQPSAEAPAPVVAAPPVASAAFAKVSESQPTQAMGSSSVDIDKRLHDQSMTISRLLTELRRTNQSVASVSTRLATVEKSCPQKISAAAETQALPPTELYPLDRYKGRAITASQAWISVDGKVYSVFVGDRLPGGLVVSRIDAERLQVETSRGTIQFHAQ